ncbi:hypothetical protein HOD30_00515 [Candidatus Peregrinibacteria bacterium]|jgi:hypothetical protein|nr:hypothetical protein [Candidatus Peregrinibacteria bacterium]MBT4631975.1 hypothetical protein [Candidatus Peregrinibacteria bacterium]MBT5517085.1 hypothetical protein [Candidatus Peregrinibacteria bacterium]MBT5823636.1 hypothetical protein [Candidatus Peregrinibacteria bacterium]
MDGRRIHKALGNTRDPDALETIVRDQMLELERLNPLEQGGASPALSKALRERKAIARAALRRMGSKGNGATLSKVFERSIGAVAYSDDATVGIQALNFDRDYDALEKRKAPTLSPDAQAYMAA